MINNSREFLRSLVESKKEVSICLRPGEGCSLMRGRIVWFDDDAIGVEFVKQEEESQSTSSKKITKKKVVLYFKSAIDNIDPGWEEEKSDDLPF